MTETSLRHHDWIANHALRRGAALAAIDLATNRRFTYQQFDARIDAVAATLDGEHGVHQDDRAATSNRTPSVRARMRLEDPATILYASGTTGLPKGVIVTYAMNLFNAIHCNSLAHIDERSVHLCLVHKPTLRAAFGAPAET